MQTPFFSLRSPTPSCPCILSPQVHREDVLVIAAPKFLPKLISTISLGHPLIILGYKVPKPQIYKLPSSEMHALIPAAHILLINKCSNALIFVGMHISFVFPCPNCPEVFFPVLYTEPLTVRNKVNSSPQANSLISYTLLLQGDSELSQPPLPNCPLSPHPHNIHTFSLFLIPTMPI